MIDYKKELNKEQLKVVTNGDGPCLVLAGAGSGKTRTITYRVAYLLEQGVSPQNILLVTFTNKAAKEMMDRVQTLTGSETRLPWSGTFHHIGYRILKQYASLLGYKNTFTVLDGQDSLEMLKMCIKQEGIDRKERRFPSAKVMQSIISYARNAETTIEDVLDLKYPNFLAIAETIKRIADDYRKRKLDSNAMDFDDLLVNWYLLLLKSPNVKEKFAEQFKYVLVDEYQDTNKVQASIIDLLASKHQNLLVVGDDAQSIYSFRAADIQNILAFSAQGGSALGGERTYPNAKIFKLETNYRSTPDILDVANCVIANNVEQYKKKLKAELDNFTKPEVHPFADNREEARFIVSRILELRDEGVELNKVAVLFRAAYHSQALEMELVKNNIFYDFRGGIRFFERAHVKDVLAYLRIVNNLDDTIAWSRILNMQVGIGPAAVDKILLGLKSIENLKDIESLGSLLPARAQIGWGHFIAVLQDVLQVERKPAEIIQAVIQSKYTEYLENEYPDYRERLQDLEQLSASAEKAEDLTSFLAEATLQEAYTAQKIDRVCNDDEKIILSTIHQAKGLEWEAVFVINLAAGQFPMDKIRGSSEMEEERRLFYVAATRAKKYLYLTYPLLGGFGSMTQGPSLFIEEIDRDLIDLNTIGGETSFYDPSDGEDDVTYTAWNDDSGTASFLKGLDEL